jgi:hypothetical protein
MGAALKRTGRTRRRERKTMTEEPMPTVRTGDCVFRFDTHTGILYINDVDEGDEMILFPDEVVAMLKLLADHRETVYRKAQEHNKEA